MDSIVAALNLMNSNIANKNIIPGAITGANPDGTYTVLATIDKDQSIELFNRESDDPSVSFVASDSSNNPADLNIQVFLSNPNGDINRARISKLAQLNFPPSPIVKHFNTAYPNPWCHN